MTYPNRSPHFDFSRATADVVRLKALPLVAMPAGRPGDTVPLSKLRAFLDGFSSNQDQMPPTSFADGPAMRSLRA